jgi:hypothetical protein
MIEEYLTRAENFAAAASESPPESAISGLALAICDLADAMRELAVRVEPKETVTPAFEKDGKWYFWARNGAEQRGPFPDQEAALKAFRDWAMYWSQIG